MMMESFRTNFWLILPVLIIIPTIVASIIIHEANEQEMLLLGYDRLILDNEFRVKEISSNIESTYELIDSKADFLISDAIVDGVVSDEEKQNIDKEFEEINEILPINIMLLDKNFEVYYSQGNNALPINATLRDFFDVETPVNPSSSEIIHVFENDTSKVLFSHHYSNSENFQGTLLIMFDLNDLVKEHGNVETEEEQFLFIIDKNYDIIVDPTLVGENLFESPVVDYIGFEEDEARHYEIFFEKNKLHTSIYTNNFGERIDTGIPIFVNDAIEYYLFVITPTSTMQNFIGDIIITFQIQTIVLLTIAGLSIVVVSFKHRNKIKVDKLAIIGQLSSNVAHDIRNPLGAIRNSSIIIDKENKNANEKISRELQRIKISTKRISHQVEEVLNYVRTTPLHLKQNSMVKTIQDSIDSIDIPETISVKLPQNDVVLSYDRDKVLIVFVNVILNAIQAIDEKEGHISISIKEKRSDVLINFENSGPAIPDDVLPKLFEPLFTTRLKGTGLGLSSCKNIIEQHNGKITVKQDPVTFTIQIPKKQS